MTTHTGYLSPPQGYSMPSNRCILFMSQRTWQQAYASIPWPNCVMKARTPLQLLRIGRYLLMSWEGIQDFIAANWIEYGGAYLLLKFFGDRRIYDCWASSAFYSERYPCVWSHNRLSTYKKVWEHIIPTCCLTHYTNFLSYGIVSLNIGGKPWKI